MFLLAAGLALVFANVRASPLHRTLATAGPRLAQATPAPIPPPTLVKRQDDEDWSGPESGCVYTTFPRETLTQSEVSFLDGASFSIISSETVLPATPGCLCAGGIIAGLYTDTNTGGGTQNVYCATGTPVGEPVTSVTNPICMASKNADTWSEFDMPDYLSSQATELAPYSTGFAVALADELPGLSARGYSCEWNYGGEECQPNVAADVCPEDPQASYAVMAIANFVNYLNDIFQTLQVVINTMTPQCATFPETFNPGNITTMPGSSDAGIAGTSLYFVGSLAGLIPGVGLATGTAAKGLGGLGDVAYMGGSAAGMANIGSGSGNIEVQFSSFSTISGLLGDLSQAVADGFSTFATSLLSEVPSDGFETDARQLPSILSEGGFAEPHPPFDLSMAQNLTAAIAGPGINLLWQYQGTVVAKVNKDNLPVDPCDGDTLFPSDVKYCDADGNMFVIQSKPEDPFGNRITENDMDDPTKYAVPGFDEISRYNLTVYDIVMSSWHNQLEYGPASEGPDAEDFIKGLIEQRPEWLPRDAYIFFNLYVCDFDEIDMDASATSSSLGSDQCGEWTAENAQCWFYFYLAGACPLNFAPDDGTESPWPWGYTWLVAGTSGSGLVDENGDPIGG